MPIDNIQSLLSGNVHLFEEYEIVHKVSKYYLKSQNRIQIIYYIRDMNMVGRLPTKENIMAFSNLTESPVRDFLESLYFVDMVGRISFDDLWRSYLKRGKLDRRIKEAVGYGGVDVSRSEVHPKKKFYVLMQKDKDGEPIYKNIFPKKS